MDTYLIYFMIFFAVFLIVWNHQNIVLKNLETTKIIDTSLFLP